MFLKSKTKPTPETPRTDVGVSEGVRVTKDSAKSGKGHVEETLLDLRLRKDSDPSFRVRVQLGSGTL